MAAEGGGESINAQEEASSNDDDLRGKEYRVDVKLVRDRKLGESESSVPMRESVVAQRGTSSLLHGMHRVAASGTASGCDPIATPARKLEERVHRVAASGTASGCDPITTPAMKLDISGDDGSERKMMYSFVWGSITKIE